MAKQSTRKILSESFVENHENVSEDEASELIVQCEQKINELQEERKNDENLAKAKQIVQDLNKGYSSAISHERAKIQFLLEKIEELQEGINSTGHSSK